MRAFPFSFAKGVFYYMKKDPTEKEPVTIHYFPRRLARKVAKENMKKAGYRKVNKSFRNNWRSFV